MDHTEAVREMAAERYLLDELGPEVREAFEEHLFDCPECALDLRAGDAFVTEAKNQLPELLQEAPFPAHFAAGRQANESSRSKWTSWLSWSRPIVVAPAFAALLLVLGYQNFVTLPGLRDAASEPRIVPVAASLHGVTRGGADPVIVADVHAGVSLPIDITPQPGSAGFDSYSMSLFDAQQKLIWSGAAPAALNGDTAEQSFSLEIPGARLHNGVYTVSVSGVSQHGERMTVESYRFELKTSAEAKPQ